MAEHDHDKEHEPRDGAPEENTPEEHVHDEHEHHDSAHDHGRAPEEFEGVEDLDAQGHEHPEPPAAMVADDDQGEDMELGNQALADALRISFNWLKFAMIVLVVVYLLMGVFWAGQDEMKLKLRFGEVVSDLITPDAGVRIRFPWEEVVTISTQTQDVFIRPEKTEEAITEPLHFWPGSTDPRNQQTLKLQGDGYLVTGDRNIVHMLMRVRYKVGDDQAGARMAEAATNYAFLLGPERADTLLRGLAMAAATRVVATMTVDEVLRGKAELASRIQDDLQKEIEDLEKNMGVDSLGIVLDERAVDFLAEMGGESVKNPREPFPTQDAFDFHQEANSEASRKRQEGQAEAQRMLRQAEARADQIVQQADSAAARITSRVQADLSVLQSLLKSIYGDAYQAPYQAENGHLVVPPLPQHTAETQKVEQVMRQRQYMRAIEAVFRAAAAAFVLHEPQDEDEREVWLNLNRPLQGGGNNPNMPPMR
jgi:regulator of protease activity HflC (stomatin/prohibitin superfamily)